MSGNNSVRRVKSISRVTRSAYRVPFKVDSKEWYRERDSDGEMLLLCRSKSVSRTRKVCLPIGNLSSLSLSLSLSLALHIMIMMILQATWIKNIAHIHSSYLYLPLSLSLSFTLMALLTSSDRSLLWKNISLEKIMNIGYPYDYFIALCFVALPLSQYFPAI